ncbi:MAG: type II secretion system F family protein [Phycisphaerales bacterium]|nr:type II secretion system F family protein [Phycisphaerales bacterium]
MPAFEYTGQLPQGTEITGTFEAASIDDARQQLAGLTIHVSSLSQTQRIKSRRALSREDLLFFNQQLASLADNRIALDEGLRAVARDLQRGPLKASIDELASDLQAGIPLDKAVDRQHGRFPPLYANVLKAGAENGQLGATLLNLSNHLSLLDSTRRIVMETITYPLIVLTMLAGLVTFFMLIIVPGFEHVVYEMTYDSTNPGSYSDIALPGLTLAVMWVSHAWPFVLSAAGVLILAFIVMWFLTGWLPALRPIRGQLAGLIPGFAGARRASLIARFTNAAALGARTHQPLPALVRSAAGATGDARLIRDAEALASAAESGAPAEQIAMHSRVIPSLVTYTIQVSGARGELVEALADLARSYESIARHKMAMVRIFIGPMVILFVALIMGFAIVALLLPLISLINSLTGG